MIVFEIKKIFSKSKNRIILIALLPIIFILSFLTINRIRYTNQNGETESGVIAAKKIRTESNKWKGILSIDVLQEVIKDNNEINNSEEYNSESLDEQNKAFAHKQSYHEIAQLINSTFSEWDDFDPYAIDRVTVEEVGAQFYKIFQPSF